MAKRTCILVLILIMAGMLVTVSCGKKGTKETAEPKKDQPTAEKKEHPAAEETTQKLCPIMGNPINKELFVEYEGKKIYFCCAGCPEKFKENPEKYLKNLK
jgi:YHS domain-containing protein